VSLFWVLLLLTLISPTDWIVQKHSRHVRLKKSSHLTNNAYPTMCYLFRVATVFDANKIIGILPFGERKLETDAIRRYVGQIASSASVTDVITFPKIESPFRQFVLEMT